MMRFTLGQDPETNEYLVGDTQVMTIILRGPASQFKSIRELVDAANYRLNVTASKIEAIPFAGMQSSICAQIEAGVAQRED